MNDETYNTLQANSLSKITKPRQAESQRILAPIGQNSPGKKNGVME
jgi:hypothetical protein